VLVEAADRLRGALRATDLLSRHGGDEFVALLTDLEPLDAERVARRVAASAVAALERPLTSGTATVRLSASVGIAMFPGSAETAGELLSVADAAMYRAKAAGTGGVCLGPERVAVPEPR
jgi:diguanylate cyclase (GGDEF)-like protein